MHFGERRWVDIRDGDKEMVVVLPLGSLEQHGHHLPLLTDTLLVSAVAERVHERLAERILLLPALWVGASHHHLDFPGTVSLPNGLYSDVIRTLVGCLLRAGLRRILLLNGHGGNVAPGTAALTELAGVNDQADGAHIALCSYWTVAANAMAAEKHGMQTPRPTHACEYETSMMLHVRSDLVVLAAARASPPVLDGPFYHSELGGRANLAHRFHRLTRTGAMGRPDLATPEKGRSLLDAVVDEVCRLVEDFASWSDLPILAP